MLRNASFLSNSSLGAHIHLFLSSPLFSPLSSPLSSSLSLIIKLRQRELMSAVIRFEIYLTVTLSNVVIIEVKILNCNLEKLIKRKSASHLPTRNGKVKETMYLGNSF